MRRIDIEYAFKHLLPRWRLDELIVSTEADNLIAVLRQDTDHLTVTIPGRILLASAEVGVKAIADAIDAGVLVLT